MQVQMTTPRRVRVSKEIPLKRKGSKTIHSRQKGEEGRVLALGDVLAVRTQSSRACSRIADDGGLEP